jgi:hypothetical protein
MNVATRLAAFAAVLGLAFGGAALAGAAIDPTDDAGSEAAADNGAGEEAPAQPVAENGGHGAHGGEGPALSGLAVSEGGYTLKVERAFFTAGQTAPLRFVITDDRGRAVRDEFEVEHEKELHLIVVRRDTAIFEHLHPRRAQDGTWSTDLNLREPGVYRAYADFKIDGQKHTLATDLFVPGEFGPNRLPVPQQTDQAIDDDGEPTGDLDVELKAPGVRAGRETPVTFAITQGGEPFEELEPYLGAKGHLVVLREGDLVYLHAHPTEGGAAHAHGDGSKSTETHGNEVRFMTTFPTAGRYRLFMQFKVGGEVRTTTYTLEVPR